MNTTLSLKITRTKRACTKLLVIIRKSRDINIMSCSCIIMLRADTWLKGNIGER